MYLKSIEVYGFKSFANRIIFKFNNGITGIVGPNGSGKSNVADAVRWVLGEQSAKQLRGAKMEDVIFSGTELKKPHGSAYVAITLDNSDHKLPIDYNEVTIARRVYRSGESEYLINGVVSRLKDVHKLFFDTGIGKEGYSIIGQGQIEKILNGKPEERRELFDEAAGIVKYKKNKAATEKELEKEKMNLSRVNDILSELEKQVGPLKEQSETARRYLIFKNELKKIDINAFLLDHDRNKEQLSDYEKNLNIVENDSIRLREEFDLAKEEYEKIEHQLEEYNGLLDTLKNEIHEKKLGNQKYEGEINVLNQQALSYSQSKENLLLQVTRYESDLARFSDELSKLFEEKSVLDEKLDNADDVLDAANDEYNKTQEEIASKEKLVEDLKAEIIDILNEGGSLKARVGRYDNMLENIVYRKSQLNQRLLECKTDDEKNKTEAEQLKSKLANIKLSIEELTSVKNDTEIALEKNLEDQNKAKNNIAKYNDDIIRLKSRKEALRNLTERYEGYGNSIKKIMEIKAANKGVIGVVADIISVDQKYETAIETALGGSIQNIVTDDSNTARKMIEYLKNNKFGRATFLPISSIVDRGNVNNAVIKEDGVVGIASDLVKANPQFDKVIKYLLGRIVIIDNIQNAIAISKKYKQSLKIVTLDGELINPGGSMTGGAFRNSSNLLGRKRELDDITAEIEKLKVLLVESQNIKSTLASERDDLKLRKDNLVEEVQKLDIKKNTYKLNYNQLVDRLIETEKNINSITKENSELETQVKQININKEELQNSNKKQEEDIKENEEKITKTESEIATQKEKLDSAREQINKLNIEFNTVKQQYDFIMQNITRIRNEEKLIKTSAAETKSRISVEDEQTKTILDMIEKMKISIQENDRIISIKEQKFNKITSNKNELSATHKEFFAKREELSDQINRLDKSAFKINASIEKISEHNESLNNYMWSEYELTYNAAIDFKDDSFTDVTSLKREVTAIKSKIKQLGEVNVNAIESYKEVSERYEFLKNQHNDIIKAEANLVSIISELDREMKKQFAEKFKEIRIMFAKVFKELFGGGKAELELVDEGDILESGIKVIAQPPGKKLQNMMQLSGGEKSLTAISLLFAIQSLKPSPFCLLDEIEAALDDSNVKRFAKYLNKLTTDTQFIVITHRKGTMEAADVLYGITMQEKGISTLVSVNMIESELEE